MIATSENTTQPKNSSQIKESPCINPVGGWLYQELGLGTPLPPHAPHAVSVSLPTWQDNVDYEEGNPRVVEKMSSGYPRFCIHYQVVELHKLLLARLGNPDTEDLIAFPSARVANDCRAYILRQSEDPAATETRVAEYLVNHTLGQNLPSVTLYPVIFSKQFYKIVKSFWQHTGEIISSRLAQYCLNNLDGAKPVITKVTNAKGRYSKGSSSPPASLADENPDCEVYLEERFGRNLTPASLAQLLDSLKSRVASTHPEGASSDVYLFPTGMGAIYNAHRLLGARNSLRSVCFGFPYTDTLKILEKFGPGCIFLGHGDDRDITALETLLEGEKIAALFCEFPSNPLLKSPNIARIKTLADTHGFPIVVDDTLSNLTNLALTPFADILATSLSKIFSGDSNVMGGSLYINPASTHHDQLKRLLDSEIYEDLTFWEDIIYLERNSRTFHRRTQRANQDAEKLVDLLKTHPKVDVIFYPKYTTPDHYQEVLKPGGGFGSLFSVRLKDPRHAQKLYDLLPIAKGPSLGTNFTLTCPYTLLAHYYELDWAASYGVDSTLIRVSVGLEGFQWLKDAFCNALDALD